LLIYHFYWFVIQKLLQHINDTICVYVHPSLWFKMKELLCDIVMNMQYFYSLINHLAFVNILSPQKNFMWIIQHIKIFQSSTIDWHLQFIAQFFDKPLYLHKKSLKLAILLRGCIDITALAYKKSLKVPKG